MTEAAKIEIYVAMNGEFRNESDAFSELADRRAATSAGLSGSQ